MLVKHVPKQLSQWLLQILPTVWNTLTHSAHIYVACVVNETEEADEQVDLDGNSRIIFIFQLLDLNINFTFSNRRGH